MMLRVEKKRRIKNREEENVAKIRTPRRLDVLTITTQQIFIEGLACVL